MWTCEVVSAGLGFCGVQPWLAAPAGCSQPTSPGPLRATEHGSELVAVELALPGGDHKRGDAVTDRVDHGEPCAHEAVNTEDQHHTRHRDDGEHKQGRGEHDERGA